MVHGQQWEPDDLAWGYHWERRAGPPERVADDAPDDGAVAPEEYDPNPGPTPAERFEQEIAQMLRIVPEPESEETPR